MITSTTRAINKNSLIKWLVLLGDVLAYIVVVNIVATYFEDYTPLSITHHKSIAATIGTVFLILYSLLFPSVIHKRRVMLPEVFVRNAIVTMLSQASFAYVWHLITYDSPNEINYNTIMVLVLFSVMVLLRLIEKSFLGFIRSRGRNTRHILFIGSDPANINIYREIMADPTTGYHVLGYYSNNDIDDAPENLKKLGTRKEFIEMIDSHPKDITHADEIYCSLSHIDQEDILKIMKYCDQEMVRFHYVPRIFHNLQMSLKPEMLGNNVVYTNRYEPLTVWGNRAIKRLFDIVFSSIVILCILPFIPLVYFVIKTQSPGPLFFKQKRTGMNGLTFTMYKFRSMHVNNDADRIQATKNDPRKFPFGEFIRKTNIDELPQFLNVLKGDMSIVGPRPHMLLHTEQYSAAIEKYMVRHFAKPGITGWAQITGFRGETEELWQMEGRVQKDIWYIEHWSFWLDIRIIIHTAVSMIIPDRNAY
ncbi:MAG: undecaprenyl-phosphate glucose phosphotransferase [Prevotella sp.]|nr:undecaprenyl-phosphate glucose phosphotransferase [Candidatus Prevotella equi]